MDEPLEIVFHNLERSAAVEAAIRERFAKLEKRYDRLTHCRVSVEALHRQHRTGNVFEVHIDMLVPGAELAVSRQPQKAKERYANPDVYTSIRDAFAAAERQLKRFKRQQREDLQPQAPLFQAQVAELHPEEDWGYLLTGEGALLYFHRNAVHGRQLRRAGDGRRRPLYRGRRARPARPRPRCGRARSTIWTAPSGRQGRPCHRLPGTPGGLHVVAGVLLHPRQVSPQAVRVEATNRAVSRAAVDVHGT